MNEYLLIFLFILYNTTIISYFNNESNFSPYIMIPLINVLLVKYYFGDLDKKNIFSLSNLFYWSCVILITLIILFYYNSFNLSFS